LNFYFVAAWFQTADPSNNNCFRKIRTYTLNLVI
jgi:hypothetical protein